MTDAELNIKAIRTIFSCINPFQLKTAMVFSTMVAKKISKNRNEYLDFLEYYNQVRKKVEKKLSTKSKE
ncbi:hypothetical protein GW796_09035 [archaeon]|nr:hypothetical protein [archaeon]NCT58876.1 hypothetical protein [archaeon]